MAKILISSTTLSKALSEIPEGDSVTCIALSNGKMHIQTSSLKIIDVNAESRYHVIYPQDRRRWDSLYELLKVIPEQLIILDINDNLLNLMIQF